MPILTQSILRRFQLLLLIVIIAGLFCLLTQNKVLIPVTESVIKTETNIEVDTEEWDAVVECEETEPSAKYCEIVLNVSEREQLLRCPFIKKELADKILFERDKRPFYDWSDFKDRVPGIGLVKINKFIELGIKIDHF